MVGLALLHGVPLGCQLSAALYRGLGPVHQQACFDELEEVEPEVGRWSWLDLKAAVIE